MIGKSTVIKMAGLLFLFYSAGTILAVPLHFKVAFLSSQYKLKMVNL